MAGVELGAAGREDRCRHPWVLSTALRGRSLAFCCLLVSLSPDRKAGMWLVCLVSHAGSAATGKRAQGFCPEMNLTSSPRAWLLRMSEGLLLGLSSLTPPSTHTTEAPLTLSALSPHPGTDFSFSSSHMALPSLKMSSS